MSKHDHFRSLAERFIASINAFDVEAAVALFANDAVIDDPSTGHSFESHAGIRDYVERYFVGYRTVSRVISTRHLSDGRLKVRVDFMGDFGHEIGLLHLTQGKDGLIQRINADLE